MCIAIGLTICLCIVPSCAPVPRPDEVKNQVVVNAASPWSERIAESFVLRHPGAVTFDSLSPAEGWNYEQGLMLVALHRMWKHTGRSRYYDFVKGNMDRYVGADGAIRTYSRTEYNLDQIGPGRILLALYGETYEAKYQQAADTLRQQLQEHPRTSEGGFWHKRIYPNQMWLDGLFMAEPFYALHAVTRRDTAAYNGYPEAVPARDRTHQGSTHRIALPRLGRKPVATLG